MMIYTSSGWSPSTLPPIPRLGVWCASAPHTVALGDAFAAEVGVTRGVVQDFQNKTSWAEVEGEAWQLDYWRDNRPSGAWFDYSVTMKPDDNWATNVGTGATGAYDSHFTTLAQRLVDRGLGDTLIRLGREFNNTNSYRWYASWANRADWVMYWRRIVDAMRAVAPGLQFVWCPNSGKNPTPAELVYPGGDWVDFVGVDVYDVTWDSGPSGALYPTSDDDQLALAAKMIVEGVGGPRYWSGFARAENKRFCLPEWGLWDRGDGTAQTDPPVAGKDGKGGQDNPYFVEAMADFILEPRNAVSYHVFFNHNGGAGEGLHAITEHNGSGAAPTMPRARQAFINRFGGN